MRRAIPFLVTVSVIALAVIVIVTVRRAERPRAGAAGIADALRVGDHPERLTLMAAPPPFSLEEYRRDPRGYCSEVVPGRCMQSAEPGRETPRLRTLTPTAPEVHSGGTVRLAVHGIPHAPVTFTAKDGGCFAENRLASVTVDTGDAGEAAVTFVATPGTVAMAGVMAGSPLCSGNPVFWINVLPAVGPAAEPTAAR
jgi:hypothetical protein